MIIWQEFQALAANNPASSVSLSPESLTLFLSTYDDFKDREGWIQDTGDEITDSQWDEIEALVAKAFEEIMTPIFAMPTGAIFPVATASIPTGALECDGSTYLRVNYPALYAVLDSAFIVDADHFKTPDLRGRVPLGVGTGTGLSTYAAGASGGEENHALTTAELASHAHTLSDPGHIHTGSQLAHTHTITDPGHIHTVTDPGHNHTYNRPNNDGALLGSGSSNMRSITTGVATGNKVTGISIDNHTTGISLSSESPHLSVDGNTAGLSMMNTGSGTAHENRQPYLAVRFAIWAD